MGNPTTDALLSLTTAPQRRFFTVDGKRYEFRDRDEMSLVEIQRAMAVARTPANIETEEAASQYDGAVNTMLSMIIVEPGDLIQRLGYLHKQRLLESFLSLLPGKPAAKPPSKNPYPPRTRSK